jgi:tRNA(Ile)-lysidine synthase
MGPIDGVRRAIRRFDLLPAGTRVVVAVSGGADSVALLCLLQELSAGLGFTVAALAHVNHQLRGAESDRDEGFCRALAGRLGLPAHVERVDVRGTAAAEGRAIEDAARLLRYAALERSRRACGAERIAVGHTRDDQAETVLMKLLRGAGPRGLAGIYPRNGAVVRPLLEVGRQELRAWLADKGITHVEDASNADLANPRNLLRHEALPWLEAWFGPSVGVVLARAAEIARADEDLLAELTSACWDLAVREEPGRLSIARADVARAPLSLQRRVLLEALRRSGVSHPGFDEVETLRSVLVGEAGGAEFAGGVRAERNDAAVVLTSRSCRPAAARPFEYALPVPGRIWVPEAGALLEAETPSRGQTPGSDPGYKNGSGTLSILAGSDRLMSTQGCSP